MRKLGVATLLALTSLAWAGSASADPWKDESGHGRRSGEYSRNDMGGGHRRDREDRSDRYARQDREYKQEYNDGNCKIERKWEKGGDYKEEIKCKGGTPSRMVQGYSGRRAYP